MSDGRLVELCERHRDLIIEVWDQGIRELFTTDEEPLQALMFLSTSFQAGEYADDALWRLGQYYQGEGSDSLADAVRYYKELLLEYPDSEWSFLARIALDMR